ncbi:MAG: hypothetical protein R2991_16960, partial [Thermoanaerobaculia bacterium]
MSRAEDVAVCIVTHDSAGPLADCLRAVSRLDPPPAEVAVVDCASTDDSIAVARRAGSGLPGLV